jgi:hypothetical protein
MKDKFRVGQLVRIIVKESKRYGEKVIILAPRRLATRRGKDGSIDRDLYYTLDIVGKSGLPLGALESELEAVYDGDEPSAWKECAWKPKHLEKEK